MLYIDHISIERAIMHRIIGKEHNAMLIVSITMNFFRLIMKLRLC